MDSRRAISALIVGAMAVWAGVGRAGVSAQVPVGPRAIGMGGAFSSVADDASAEFWNPAGLPLIGHQEIACAHANLFGAGINDNYVSFVLPLSLRHAVAIDWYNSGFTDPELNFGENRVDISYGVRLRPWCFVGATGKWLNRGTDLDGVLVRRGQGFGADVGVLTSSLHGLRLGLVAQDVTNTKVHYDQGTSAEAYPRNVRFGSSYGFGRVATVAFDVDDRWHAGVEVHPIALLALRAGTESDRVGGEGNTWSYGAGLTAGVFRVDYAHVQPPTLGATDHFALSMDFNFNPSQVRIERVRPREIYSGLYESYSRDTVAVVDLYNLSDEPIQAEVRYSVPELMNAWSPPQKVDDLRPKVTTAVPLLGAFSDKALAIHSDRRVRMNVTVDYQSRRLPRSDKKPAWGYAYRPGAIDWSMGVAQAAAYVTVEDPAVDSLAAAVARATARIEQDPRTSEPLRMIQSPNLAYAAGLVDALQLLGVTYVPDPHNPYSAVSGREHAVDNVNYPYQTLEKRTGDCDDSSVLLAALLENLGVSTRFVDVPGHLFLLVSAGIPARDREAIEVPDAMLALIDDQVWIPLETTAIGKGFAEAWKAGAESYRDGMARGQAQLVDIEQAQATYPPGMPSGPRPRIVLDGGALATAVARDANALVALAAEYRQTSPASAPDSALMATRLDVLAGRLVSARARINGLLQSDPLSPRLRNNNAVVWAAQGEPEQAMIECAKALAADSLDAGIWLNLGLLFYAYDDTSTALELMQQGVSMSGGYAQACRLVGLLPGPESARQARRRVTPEGIKEYLMRAVFPKSPSQAAEPPGPGNRPVVQKIDDRARMVRNRVGPTRSHPMVRDDMYLYMYWKR